MVSSLGSGCSSSSCVTISTKPGVQKPHWNAAASMKACCTVVVNGKAVSGCLYLALFVDGADVTTIESLDTPQKLSPVQEAFIEASAFQCGYCTPGFIMMVTQLLDENPDPSDDQIKHYLTGNLCRCATYPEVMDAVRLAAKRRKTQPAV